MIRSRLGLRRARPPGDPAAADGGPRSGPAADGAPRPGLAVDDARRFLSHSEISIGPRDRLLIAGVVRPATVADLEPDARVDVLLPHDARLVIERTDPDLVLVEAAALLPGGAWAHGGDPSVAVLSQRLLGILATARSLGRPTVLWWNATRSAAPGLIPFEPQFSFIVSADPAGDDDAAVPWTPGVQLGRFNGVAIDPGRPMRPVFAGGWDPRGSRWSLSFAAAALTGLTTSGLEIWLEQDADRESLPRELRPFVSRLIDPARVDTTYRDDGLFLTDPLASLGSAGAVAPATLRQLASGARVVSGPNEALAGAIDDGVTWMAAPADAPRAVREAIDRGPIAGAERRLIQRTLFERHATAIAVADLARSLGLRVYPSRARHACAVVQLGGDVQGDTFVDGILAQRHRPTEAILVSDNMATTNVAIAELEAAGVAARRVAPNEAGGYTLADLAAITTAGWLWVWTPDRRLEPTLLLDLLVGAAVSDADAVGWVDGEDDGFVGALPVAGSIVSRRAALARPEPVDGGLGEWLRKGGRLFGLDSGVDAGSSGDR
jgi:hypothetical protein